MTKYVGAEHISVRPYCRASERQAWSRSETAAARRARCEALKGRSRRLRGGVGKSRRVAGGARVRRACWAWEFAAGGQGCTQAAADTAVARLLRESCAHAADASVDAALIDPTAVYALDSQGRLCVVP